jgi:copper transport protein
VLRLLLLLALALPVRALAHASLLGSEPADGVSLDAAPSSVVLRFDETVTLIALRLVGPDGRVSAAGAGRCAR